MRKYLTGAVLFLLYVNINLFPEKIDEPLFSPVSPEVLAQGGSFVAVAKGYNSLFTNPAGFACDEESLTLLCSGTTAYFIPTENRIKSYYAFFDNPEKGLDGFGSEIDSGIGAGSYLGFGYIGKGLGLGLVSYGETYVSEKEGETNFAVLYTSAFIFGYAWSLDIKDVNLCLGLDMRPMIRAHALNISLDDLNAFYAEPDDESAAFPVLKGETMALDFGLLLNWGDFNIGLSLRDVFAEFNYKRTSSSDFYNAQGIPSGGEDLADDEVYEIPMNFSVGIAYMPEYDLLDGIIKPKFHFEYKEVFYNNKKQGIDEKYHAGTELLLFNKMKLRAGIDRGYFTCGAGIKISALDINIAYFETEPENSIEMNANAGISMEFALRF